SSPPNFQNQTYHISPEFPIFPARLSTLRLSHPSLFKLRFCGRPKPYASPSFDSAAISSSFANQPTISSSSLFFRRLSTTEGEPLQEPFNLDSGT
ncbi:hypothetical protein LINGRAHAP2_LOCUS15494, partial [Linum grandiflorum]